MGNMVAQQQESALRTRAAHGKGKPHGPPTIEASAGLFKGSKVMSASGQL